MKRIIAFLLLVCFTFSAFSGTTILFGSLTVVNGTSNTMGYAVGTMPVPRGTFTMLNDGSVTNTNSLTINIQASIDGTNYINIGTYHPSAVGISNELFIPTYTNLQFILRGQAITTNPIGVGGFYNN